MYDANDAAARAALRLTDALEGLDHAEEFAAAQAEAITHDAIRTAILEDPELVAEAEAFRTALRKVDDHFGRRGLTLQEAIWGRAELVAEAASSGRLSYTAADVVGWMGRARRLGTREPRLGVDTVERVWRYELIPNAALRERYEYLVRIGEGAHVLKACARALGDRSLGDADDTSNVRRHLGLDTHNGTVAMFVKYEVAEALARPLGLAPFEAGV